MNSNLIQENQQSKVNIEIYLTAVRDQSGSEYRTTSSLRCFFIVKTETNKNSFIKYIFQSVPSQSRTFLVSLQLQFCYEVLRLFNTDLLLSFLSKFFLKK